MATSGMYVKKTKVAEICGGKIDFQLRVRVINLWSTPNRANSAEEGALHMIFLDEGLGKIHTTVRKDLIPQFKDQIEEGCAYVFEKFMVAKNDSSFRRTSHKHKLNFMRGTKVYKVTAIEIPKNHFSFMSFQDIISMTNDDQMLVCTRISDVIGHVAEKNVMRETVKNGKISKVMDVTLEDLEGNRVHCTLWDDFAQKMQQFLDTHDSSHPVVIIFQLCKLKKYLGSMGISNSFYGSKLLLNAQIPEVSDYIERMNVANVELTQVVSQMRTPVVLSLADDLLHTRRMTIEDLIESIEKCCASVLVWACELDTNAGWFYQACTKCASRINFIGGQLRCEKCKMPRTAIPRFKLHLQVMDDTGSITFVMFDRTVSNVLGRTAQDLVDAMNHEQGSNAYPSELDVFVDKRMLFKVEVTDANLYRNWRGYTVKKLSDDEDIINRFATLHGINLASDAGDIDCVNLVCHLGDDASLDVFEGGDSTNNDDVLLTDVLKTPTSKSTSSKTVNVDGVYASAVKGPAPSASKLCAVDANPSLASDVLKTPTSKSISNKTVSVDIADASAAKGLAPSDPKICAAGANPNLSIKHVGKRSANVGASRVGSLKDTKIACVKIEDPK